MVQLFLNVGSICYSGITKKGFNHLMSIITEWAKNICLCSKEASLRRQGRKKYHGMTISAKEKLVE